MWDFYTPNQSLVFLSVLVATLGIIVAYSGIRPISAPDLTSTSSTKTMTPMTPPKRLNSPLQNKDIEFPRHGQQQQL